MKRHLNLAWLPLDEKYSDLLALGSDLLRLLDTNAFGTEQIHGALKDIVRQSRLRDACEESILEANGCLTLTAHKMSQTHPRDHIKNVVVFQ